MSKRQNLNKKQAVISVIGNKKLTQDQIEEFDGNLFKYEDKKFIVLTPEEANKYAESLVLDKINDLDTNFIAEYVFCLDSSEDSKQVINGLKKSKSASLHELIDDKDKFIKNAVQKYGRQTFIPTKDGMEHVVSNYNPKDKLYDELVVYKVS